MVKQRKAERHCIILITAKILVNRFARIQSNSHEIICATHYGAEYIKMIK